MQTRHRCLQSISGVFAKCGLRLASTAAPIQPSYKDMRSHLHTPAVTDFVKDYRMIAGMSGWDSILHRASGSVRVLDVCAGTGRWAQAFSELVVKDHEVLVDFVDLCGDSIAVLGSRQETMANLGKGKLFTGDICELGKLGVPLLSYDLIVNMHGLYGISRVQLPAALQAMHDALKPGGTMIIAIGTESSPYQQIPTRCFGVSFTNDQDILEALNGLGIGRSVNHITYTEEFAASDKSGLDRFLMDECGGNTFPAEVAQGMTKPERAIQEYADCRFDHESGTHRFEQQTSVITIRREAGLPPQLQSVKGRVEKQPS